MAVAVSIRTCRVSVSPELTVREARVGLVELKKEFIYLDEERRVVTQVPCIAF